MDATPANSTKAKLAMNLLKPPLSLKIYPDPVLRQVCEPVEGFNGEIRDLIDEMHNLMRACHGVGLAAPQVGILKRLFVCELEGSVLSITNPKIKNRKYHSEMVEGCLSLPEVRISVKRSNKIFLVAYNPQGKRIKFRLSGLWARVVQHELDHLNGVLICDYEDKSRSRFNAGDECPR